MTHPIYSRNQLESMNRSQLWAVCGQLGVKKFPKSADCVDAILAAQPQPVSEPVQDYPTKENPWTVEEATQKDYVFSAAGVGNFLTVKGYNDKGWVIVNDGYDNLVFSPETFNVMTHGRILASKPQPVEPAAVEEETTVTIEYDNSIDGLTQPYVVRFDDGGIAFRHATHAGCMRHCQWKGYTVLDNQEIAQGEFEQDLEVAAQSIAPENPELVAYDFEKECFSIPVFMGEEPELNDDYLFHNDPQPQERGSGRDKLPRVGDTHTMQGFLLRCIAVGGENAVTWEVCQHRDYLGEVAMGWDCKWTRTMSNEKFDTVQQAIADLCESIAEETNQEQELMTNEEIISAIESACDSRNRVEFRDDYSGRGMSGIQCCAVVCYDTSEVDEIIDELSDRVDDNQLDKLRDYWTDSMGMDTVVYWVWLSKEDELVAA